MIYSYEITLKYTLFGKNKICNNNICLSYTNSTVPLQYLFKLTNCTTDKGGYFCPNISTFLPKAAHGI